MVKLIDFYADWCGPCIIMKPVVEELEKELAGKIQVEKINVDENPKKTEEFQVFSIPTYVILKEDKEVERFIGATGKDRLLRILEKYLERN